MASHLAWAPVSYQAVVECKQNQSSELLASFYQCEPKACYPITALEKKGGGEGGRKEKSGLNQINPNPHTLPQTITQSYNLKVVEWFNHKYPGSLVIGLLVCTAEMEWLGPLVNKRKERSITNGVPLWSKVVKAAFR